MYLSTADIARCLQIPATSAGRVRILGPGAALTPAPLTSGSTGGFISMAALAPHMARVRLSGLAALGKGRGAAAAAVAGTQDAQDDLFLKAIGQPFTWSGDVIENYGGTGGRAAGGVNYADRARLRAAVVSAKAALNAEASQRGLPPAAVDAPNDAYVNLYRMIQTVKAAPQLPAAPPPPVPQAMAPTPTAPAPMPSPEYAPQYYEAPTPAEPPPPPPVYAPTQVETASSPFPSLGPAIEPVLPEGYAPGMEPAQEPAAYAAVTAQAQAPTERPSGPVMIERISERERRPWWLPWALRGGALAVLALAIAVYGRKRRA